MIYHGGFKSLSVFWQIQINNFVCSLVLRYEWNRLINRCVRRNAAGEKRKERIVNIAHSYQEADRYDIEQQIQLTYAERMKAARILKERVYGKQTKDVRACHLKK